jgi:hypothetical protein
VVGQVLIVNKCNLSAILLLTLFLLSRPAAQAQEETSKYELGFEQQIRSYSWNNLYDFNNAKNDERLDVRYRTRVWGRIALGSNVDVFAGLIQETKQFITPTTPCHFDEIAFENLYVDFKKLPIHGLSLRIGRQSISRGDGFILNKGTATDGSRTQYFNAFNLSYARKQSRLEIIGILQPYTDRLLPVIHDRSRMLVEWDEQALGAYYTDNNSKATKYEAYYFYKKEFRDRRAATDSQFQPDRHIHTLGGRIVRQLAGDWEADGELAAQWGVQHPSIPVRGFAGYGYLKKRWNSQWTPSLSFGYFGMSGDNPGTKNKIEGWDPLFSRYMKWSGSDLYILTLQREKGFAYWTNTGMWRAQFELAPLRALTTRFTYYRMNAFHPFDGDPEMYGTGTTRGNLYQARAEVKVNNHWKSYMIYERFFPGSFYTSHSPANFLLLVLSFNIAAKYPS